MDASPPRALGPRSLTAESWLDRLDEHRSRLRKMVALRLDQRLQGRIDPSDVLQEALLEAARTPRPDDERRDLPVFLWLRHLVGLKLMEIHRRHLGAKGRDAGREVSICQGGMPEASSAALAAQLLGRDTRPSEAAARAERKLRLQTALDTMDQNDREILVLRHFEELTNAEAALALQLKESAASKRYIRALRRLKDILVAE